MKSIAVAVLLFAPGIASAQAIEWRLDHRNQPSILASVLFEQLTITAADKKDEGSEGGVVADLAVGLPVGDHGGEVFIGLRIGSGGGERRLVAPNLFYRVYAGDEEWKTFFDAGVMLRIEPLIAPSGRLGLGVQYDFHENWGAFLAAGGSVGYGEGLQIGVDGGVGLQFRFGTAG